MESSFKINDYTLQIDEVPTKPGCRNYLNVKIFKHEKELGSYTRNYSSFYKTFYPFSINGKEYALFSSNYVASSVMSLPDCKEIASEDKTNPFGFCPVDFYVPAYKLFEYKGEKYKVWDSSNDNFFEEVGEIYYIPYGFVAGCVWGDDSSWKLQLLDLTEIEKGIIKRDQRFGYLSLAYKTSLKDCICIDDDFMLRINVQKIYHIDTNFKVTNHFPAVELDPIIKDDNRC